MDNLKIGPEAAVLQFNLLKIEVKLIKFSSLRHYWFSLNHVVLNVKISHVEMCL